MKVCSLKFEVEVGWSGLNGGGWEKVVFVMFYLILVFEELRKRSCFDGVESRSFYRILVR